MADKTVNIKVVDGKIVCDRVHVEKNETIVWKCAHPFTVDFGWYTPLEDHKEDSKGNIDDPDAPGNKKTVDERIKSDADKKGHPLRFKYTVAVYNPGDAATAEEVLIEDPEVIIDP